MSVDSCPLSVIGLTNSKLSVYLVVVALPNENEPERVSLHIINNPVFPYVVPQERISSQLFKVVRLWVFEQGKYLFNNLPELFRRQAVQKLLRFLANEKL